MIKNNGGHKAAIKGVLMDLARISCYVNAAEWKKFQKAYPSKFTRFIANCVKMAIIDKQFFERIFWL